MSELPAEEIVEIVTGFLLNSPPGEFMEVVTDVRGLLKDESLLNSSAPATFRAYNTDQFLEVSVGSPQQHKLLITGEGQVSDNEYLDPRGNQVVTFDHIRQEVTGTRPISGELDHDVEPFRAAFDNAFQTYCSEHYQQGTSIAYGKREGGQHVITLCLSSFRFNPSNYWNGRWRSQWTCKFSPGQNINLNGQIRVNVHYYEDGNVQLTTDTPKTASVPGGANPQAAASAAINAIKKIEQEYHSKLENSYNTLSDTTFKALRRVLPITRNKIEWPRIQTYKMDLKGQ